MSMESAKAFIERMKTDEEFARQVSNQKDNEERMKFVTAEGFNFSGEEIKKATEDLADVDLVQATGGLSGSCIKIVCDKPWVI